MQLDTHYWFCFQLKWLNLTTNWTGFGPLFNWQQALFIGNDAANQVSGLSVPELVRGRKATENSKLNLIFHEMGDIVPWTDGNVRLKLWVHFIAFILQLTKKIICVYFFPFSELNNCEFACFREVYLTGGNEMLCWLYITAYRICTGLKCTEDYLLFSEDCFFPM